MRVIGFVLGVEAQGRREVRGLQFGVSPGVVGVALSGVRYPLILDMN